jgi:hypothetical protein
MKKLIIISVKSNNVNINGKNSSMHEARIDGLYSVDKIKEYILEKYEIKNIEFEDGDDQEVNALLELKELAEIGDIYHDIYTGEEWLGNNNEGKILLGRGDATDWGEYSGEPENREEWLNEKNWKPIDGKIRIQMISVPEDGQPGLINKLCFVQKNTEVTNPVNDNEGWMDEFKVIKNRGDYFAVSKRLY